MGDDLRRSKGSRSDKLGLRNRRICQQTLRRTARQEGLVRLFRKPTEPPVALSVHPCQERNPLPRMLRRFLLDDLGKFLFLLANFSSFAGIPEKGEVPL